MGRAVRGSFWVAFIAAATACGVVTFVPSPYAPRELSVVYSEQEDVTVLRWKLGARVDPDDVRFELVIDGQWAAIDFDEAPFPSGDYDCANATCFQVSRRGRYEVPAEGIVLRSLHEHHGMLAAGPVALETLSDSLEFHPRFRAGNATVALAIEDALSPSGTSVRRRFRWHLVESATPCAPSTAFEGVTEGVEVVPFDERPSELGRYCATLEPVANDERGVVRIAAEAFTHPELEAVTHTYVAPFEEAPVYVQVIVDLEIPNEERCLATVARVQEQLKPLLAHGPGGGHAVEPIWLAESDGIKCRQNAAAALDVPSIVEAMKQYVAQHAPGRHGAAIVFVYLSNLTIPMNDWTAFSLLSLVESFRVEQHATAALWAISSSPSSIEPVEGFVLQTSWTSPFDKSFEDLVKSYDRARFPVRSSLHDDQALLPLVDAGSVGATDVVFKLCGATPKIRLNRGTKPLPLNETIMPVSPGEPIWFRVDFDRRRWIDASLWIDQTVTIRYELCRRWCTHPFESASGAALAKWTSEAECREAP